MSIRFSIDRLAYEAFCASQTKEFPVFLEAWWLDAACLGEANWLPCVIKQHDQINGVWPLFIKQKNGIKAVTMPQYTPYGGPYFIKGTQPNEVDLVYLLEQIKVAQRTIYTLQHPFYSSITPDIWANTGFVSKQFHTYILDCDQSEEQLFSKLRSDTKSRLRKAEKSAKIEILDNFELFKPILDRFLSQKGLKRAHDIDVIKGIWEASKARKQGEIYVSLNDQDQITAGVLVVRDQRSSYLLLTVTHPDGMSSQGHRVLIWHAIKLAAARNSIFDFEGGNIPSIGAFFASFGAQKVPYLRVAKYPNKPIQWLVKKWKTMRGVDPTFT
jgi:Acetyltransferase (GNAT) domain